MPNQTLSTPSVWIVPAKGMTEPERVGAFQRGVISPDASQIALVHENSGVKELLLLPSGRRATAPHCSDSCTKRISAASSGQWMASSCSSSPRGGTPNCAATRASFDPSTCPLEDSEEILSAANLSGDAISLPDGRLVYGQLLGANPAGSYGAELRQVHVDPRTDHVARRFRFAGQMDRTGSWT